MGNPYPANFETLEGSRRLTGQVDFTDSGNQPGATYAPPTDRALYSGNNVNIGAGGQDILSWDSLDGGTALLDIATDAKNPTALVAGIYAIGVVARGTSLTAATSYQATLVFDLNGIDAELLYDSLPSTATVTSPRLVLSGTYYLPAGGITRIQITNNDSAGRNFKLTQAIVQRIT